MQMGNTYLKVVSSQVNQHGIFSPVGENGQDLVTGDEDGLRRGGGVGGVPGRWDRSVCGHFAEGVGVQLVRSDCPGFWKAAYRTKRC